MAEKLKALYKGKTQPGGAPQFVFGVPARSLTPDEWDALDAETQDAVRAAPFYEVRSEHEMTAGDGKAPARAKDKE